MKIFSHSEKPRKNHGRINVYNYNHSHHFTSISVRNIPTPNNPIRENQRNKMVGIWKIKTLKQQSLL